MAKKAAGKKAAGRSVGFRFVSEDEGAARGDDALGELSGRRIVLGIAVLVPLTQLLRLVKGALLPSAHGDASGGARRLSCEPRWQRCARAWTSCARGWPRC